MMTQPEACARRSTALKGMISPVDAADAVALGDAREHGQAGHDPAEYGVGAVEVRLGGVGDEELAAARIGAGKRHAHRTCPVTRGIHLVPEHEAGAAPPVAARVPVLRRVGRPRLRAPGRGESHALRDRYDGHGAFRARYGRQPVLHHPLRPAAPRRHLHRLRPRRGRPQRARGRRSGRSHPQHPPLMRRSVWRALLLLAALPAAAPAQFGYFGQNKIQYRSFDWRVLRGEHVDLYFYPEEDELGRVALAYAEESYGVLERRFTHHVQRRVPLIIYASHTDFEQTNVLPFVPPEGLLGVTEFLKRRVALPFTGSYSDFRHTIRHELVHVFQLSLVAEVFRRYPRFRRAELPLWWSEGLAEFFSAGEDSRDEMILRDLTLSGRLPTLRELAYAAGGIVYPVGGVIHRFLALSSGEWRIGELYRDLWKYSSFEDAVQGVYGRPLDQLSDEWQFWMRRRYYPSVAAGEPLALTARVLTKLAIKPAVYRTGDSAGGILYFSPSTGYTNIYAQPFAGGRARAVVKGERTAEFESFHFFESRLDVSPAGVVVFSSKYLDRDAVFFWSLARQQVVGRYQFPQLVSILSPTWAPDGRSVVFSGLAVSGYSDLYRLWLPDGRLEPLTADRYQDLDPTFSADGGTVVFSSDRTGYGPGAARHLFRLELATGRIDYLTYGDWRDDQPRWSAETGRIYFASDRDGTYQIYAVDSTGAGDRGTSTPEGAFDPQC